MSLTSGFEKTASVGTSQNRAIFSFVSGSSRSSERPTRMSGWSPIERSSFTECWVGFVFCSPFFE